MQRTNNNALNFVLKSNNTSIKLQAENVSSFVVLHFVRCISRENKGMCGQIAGLPMGNVSGLEFRSETPSTLTKTRINPCEVPR
jgi:hypothetical protein